MPNCDMCGKNKELTDAIVEGTMLSVCEECARYGKVIPIRKPDIPEQIAKKPIRIEESDEAIVPDFHIKVKEAREKKKLKQEELAKEIAEKESVIQNLESGRLIPNIKLAKKLEQYLNIQLIIKEESEEEPKRLDFKNNTLTIGDLLKLKK